MKKIMAMAVALMLVYPAIYGAYKDQHTIKGYTSDGQIKGISSPEDVKIYRVTWQATANSAYFGIYDAADFTEESNDTIRIEGSEATSGNGGSLDFSDDPVEFSTGAYLNVYNMNVVVEYE